MKLRFAIVALAGTLLAGVIGTSSALAAAPVNTSQPTIVGTPEQGKTLTARNGVWTNSPTAFSYQWQRSAADDDIVVEKNDAKVLIDSLSLVYMAGSEIDFVDNLLGQSFQIKNPNAVASCGCGTSFAI